MPDESYIPPLNKDPYKINVCDSKLRYNEHKPSLSSHGNGKVPSDVCRRCELCGNYIVYIGEMLWVAIPESEFHRAKAIYDIYSI